MIRSKSRKIERNRRSLKDGAKNSAIQSRKGRYMLCVGNRKQGLKSENERIIERTVLRIMDSPSRKRNSSTTM